VRCVPRAALPLLVPHLVRLAGDDGVIGATGFIRVPERERERERESVCVCVIDPLR
jgi:hypothetical protein